MPWIGPTIAAGAGIVGDLFSQSGQASTNAAMLAMQKQNEDWQTSMANTQMQRRVTDLRAAGLNPMLAVGGPGAAMPSFQQPNLQNPASSFSNLGQQVSNAVQTATIASQIKANEATASNQQANADYTTGKLDSGEITAQVDYLKSMTGLNDVNAKVAQNNVEYIASQIANVREDTARLNIQNLLSGQNYQVLVATKQALISAANSDADAKGLNVQILRTNPAVTMPRVSGTVQVINQLLEPVSTAAGIAAKGAAAGRAIGGVTTQTSQYGPGGVDRGGSVTTVK